ncbi:MAG: FRG domain-containing protein [Pseudomonadota bacterium]
MQSIVEHKIHSLHEYVELLENQYSDNEFSRWVYRGHADHTFELMPSIGRHFPRGLDSANRERSILTIFKKTCEPVAPERISNDLDWLAFAQHHELPTRLLDWSSVPTIALYFCCREHEDRDGHVYALFAEQSLSSKRYETEDPFKIRKAHKFVPPPALAPRLKAQHGVFTIQPKATLPLDEDLPRDWILEKITVPASAKLEIRKSLFRLGVDEATLFPDAGGIARHIKWRHLEIRSSLRQRSAPQSETGNGITALKKTVPD